MEIKYIHSFLSNLPSIIFMIFVLLKSYTMIISLTIVVSLVALVKELSNYLPKDSALYRLTRRPEKGLFCGLSCLEKKTSISDPGFPSGHVAFITFYTLCLPSYSVLYTIIKGLLILLVSYNRLKSGCHTILQVIGGIVFGGYLQRFIML
jgi:membrane-associated phospholipid phosphatase